jgi:hypothetical protein
MDTNLFFPDSSEHVSAEVIFVCTMCPVRGECAEWAINNESQGVYAGLSGRERGRIRAERGLQIRITKPLQPCGTRAAYQRHLAKREAPCAECVDAYNKYQRDRNARAVA